MWKIEEGDARAFIEHHRDIHSTDPIEWATGPVEDIYDVAWLYLQGYDEDTNAEHEPSDSEIHQLATLVQQMAATMTSGDLK